MPLSALYPVIDDRTYADLVAEVRTRIPRYTPEWTDFNESDPGMAMVELFAWMSELLIYRLGKVPQLNYLKFLELIGFELAPASPARAEIAFPINPSWPLPTVTIPMGTEVSTDTPDDVGPIIFELDRALVAITAPLDAVQVMEPPMFKDATRANADGRTGFAAFGNLARTGAALLLGFRSALPFPDIELELAFFVQPAAGAVAPLACGSGDMPGGAIAWEYWNGSDWLPMALVEDQTAGLMRDGHVRVQLPATGSLLATTMGAKTDAPRYWIRARLAQSYYQLPPRLLAVRTNTATATQAQTISFEVLGGSNGTPDQVFKTSAAPVLAGSLQLEVDEGDSDGPQAWTEVSDLFGAGPDDLVYVLNRSTGEVRFGDGTNGRIPVANAANPQNIVAVQYRTGGGARGNVGAGKLTSLLGAIAGVAANQIANPFASGGGADEESLADAIKRAPSMLRTRDRAVTPEDFEALALQAGVARAKALPLFHPSFPTVEVPGVISVIVVPQVPGPAPMPNPMTLRTVCDYLQPRRLLTAELYVIPPRYRTIAIQATLVPVDGVDAASVQEAASAAVRRYFDPLTGGDDGTGWPFGGGIYYSRVIRLLLVDGVERVASLTMQLDDEVAAACSDLAIDPDELLISGNHLIEVDA